MPDPIGTLLDRLDVKATIDPDDLPAGAVVLLKIIEPDGAVRLQVSWSDGMSWLERRGMLAAALDGDGLDDLTETP